MISTLIFPKHEKRIPPQFHPYNILISRHNPFGLRRGNWLLKDANTQPAPPADHGIDPIELAGGKRSPSPKRHRLWSPLADGPAGRRHDLHPSHASG